jgi:predicted DNA-binding transcriptional regulator YafY
LLRQRLLKFSYLSPQAEGLSARQVEPHHLQHYMGSWVLIAYCRQRQDWRKFFLSRMRDLQSLTQIFACASWPTPPCLFLEFLSPVAERFGCPSRCGCCAGSRCRW